MQHSIISRLAALWLLGFLTGCGSGSLDSDSNTPSPAVLVNAGPDFDANEQSTVTLSAQATGETDTLTFSWSISPDVVLTQEDTSVGAATFVAPQTTEDLLYTATVTVTDGNGNQGSDVVQVTISPVNALPVAQISVISPQLDDETTLPAGTVVTLSAAGSVDSDAADNANPFSAWLWQQTAGVTVLNANDASGQTISFTTPIGESASTLTFELTVTDSEGGQDTTQMSFNVLSQAQTLPSVNAGQDHQVFPGENIVLDGAASTPVSAAEPLTFLWRVDATDETAINDSDALQTFAIAPAADVSQTLVFTLQVTDGFGNQVLDTVSATVLPLPRPLMNDTGVFQQADNDNIATAHRANFPGQDGQRGLDRIAANNELEKAGRGAQGFDFTRLDAIGDAVDDTAEPFSCVRDNITGLIWEVKTSDGGLHSSEHRYSWAQTEDNGGFGGDPTELTGTCSLVDCNTDAFVAAANAAGLCNFFDWRLPTHDELLSLLHFGQTSSPLIDRDNFPNTARGTGTPLWYWTRVSSADGVSGDGARTAWAIDFASGNDNFLNKGTGASVRLVRGGR